MWWEPETVDERYIAEILPGMQAQFVERIQERLVLGVGSIISPIGLRPLVLVNLSLDPDMVEFLRDRPRRVFARAYWLRYVEHIFRGRYRDAYLMSYWNARWQPVIFPPLIAFWPYDYPYHPDDHPLFRRLFERLNDWRLPAATVVLFVTPPEPVMSLSKSLRAHDYAIRCHATHERSTLALALQSSKDPALKAFLTVGHAAPLGVGSIIDSIKFGIFSDKYEQFGTVKVCNVPAGVTSAPDYDAAIVEAFPTARLPVLSHSGFAKMKSPLTQPLLATLYGGVSGVVRHTGLCGALTAYGGPTGIWKNSWLIFPSGTIKQGDSGGILALENSKQVAGMVVGGSREPNSTEYMTQYAHDIESLQRDLLSPNGFVVN